MPLGLPALDHPGAAADVPAVADVAHARDAGRVISVEDLLLYVDDALDGMVGIVESLGDDLANRRPDLPGANSPYAVLTHCLGVMTYWAGELIAGRVIDRDRPAEFTASGPVADLVARVRDARGQLAEDLAGFDGFAPLRGKPDPADTADPFGQTQGGALVHVYEELAQHRGQMEVTRDVLLAPWVRFG